MKYKTHLFTILSTVLLCSFTSKPFEPISPRETFETSAAYDKSKALDFTDSTTEEINDYYNYEEMKNLKGNSLKDYLYNKIKDTYFVTYAKSTDWMKITDRNWDLSAPIDPLTYTFSQDKGDNYKITLLYYPQEGNTEQNKAINFDVNSTKMTVDESLDYVDYINNRKPNSNVQIDKEHIWAKSHGFGGDPKPGAGTDLHHLQAADHAINSYAHNDLYFGEVIDKTTETEKYAYLGDGTKIVAGYRGLDQNGKEVFEPSDEWKGDIARSLFYMTTRYGYQNPEGNTQAEPYLYFSDTDEDQPDKFYGVHPNLKTYLEWNVLDPVSEYERHRNNLIYKNVQHNRNPFIDYFYSADYSQYFANSIFDPDGTLLPSLVPSPFGTLKDSYQLHTGEAIDLNINTDSLSSLHVDYDKEGLILNADRTKITAVKEGTYTVVFKGTNKLTQKEETKTVLFTIKELPQLLSINPDVGKPTSMKFVTGDTYPMQLFFVDNKVDLFETETICITSDDESIVKVENNTLHVQNKEGETTINIVIHDSNGTDPDIKIFSFTAKVVLKSFMDLLNKKYIIIIVVASILLILVFIGLAILIHRSNKKGSRNKNDKEFHVNTKTKKYIKKMVQENQKSSSSKKKKK